MRRNYLLSLIVIGLISLSLYSTYAMFTASVETDDIVNLTASTLPTSTEVVEYERITVEKNSEKTIEFTIKNSTNKILYYGTWYEMIKPSSINDSIVVARQEESEKETLGQLNSSETAKVSLIVKNNTSSDIIVNLGVGYSNTNSLNLPENRNLITDVYKEIVNKDANSPDLVEGLIPITYKDNKWVKADERNGDSENLWYDYNSQKWANAVLVNNSSRSTYQNASVGTEVKEADVLAYYVWIPRYKYKLFNADKVEGTDSYNARTTGIDIVFENGKEKTGTVTCNIANNGTESCTGAINGAYYTHPAFTFGNIELKGIWVGKFELTGDTTTPTIKPNLSSLRYIGVSTINNTIAKISENSNSYGVNSDKSNSHMIKNIEWGVVAYLTNSKYGICPNGICTEMGVNNNRDYITGCGAKLGSSSSSCNTYTTTNGMLASTTANVYGVYDMSGGTYEYVMANMVDNVGGFNYQGSGFSNVPESKYYDKYSYSTSSNVVARGHLGDATSEIIVSGYKGWNNNNVSFVNSNYTWLSRSGGNGNGLFSSSAYIGYDDHGVFSSRAVLVNLE